MQEGTSDNVGPTKESVGESIMTALPSPATSESLVNADVNQLVDSIKTLHDSDRHFSFWMAVSRDDGKAHLVPVPTRVNFVKMKEYYEQLPKRIRNTIERSMAKDDFASFESIIKSLNTHQTRALEDTSKGEAAINNDEDSDRVE